MSTVLRCPACGRKVPTPEPTGRKFFRCPACDARVPVPEPDGLRRSGSAIPTAARAHGDTVGSTPGQAAARPRRVTDRDEDRAGDRLTHDRRVARDHSATGLVIGLAVGGTLLLLLVLGGLGLAVYFAASAAREVPAPEWQPFAPAAGGFTVLMPGTPADLSQVTDGVFVNKFVVERPADGARFSVLFFDLRPGSLRPNSLDVLTEAERDRLAAPLNGRVSGTTPVALGDVPGRQFRVTAPDGRVLVSRVYLAQVGGGHRLYEVVAAGRAIIPDQGDAARFFDSLRLDGAAPLPPVGPVAQGLPPPKPPAPGGQPQPARAPPGVPGARPVWREDNGTRTVALTFAPDGGTLAVAHYDRRLRLWDVARSADRQVIPVDIGVTTVAFSKDGSRLAAGSGNGWVIVFDPAAPKELRRFQVLHTQEQDHTQVRALAFAPDGKSLAVAVVPGNSNSEVHLWDLDANKERAALPDCKDAVQKMAFAADGSLVVLLSTSAKVCDAATLRVRRDIKGQRPEEEIVASAVSPDGRTLATVSDDKKLRLWQIADGACQQTWPTKADAGRGMYSPLEFSPDGKLLALGTRGPNLCLWDARTGKELKVTRLGGSAGTIGLVTFSPDGRLVACAGTSGPWVLEVAPLLDDRPK